MGLIGQHPKQAWVIDYPLLEKNSLFMVAVLMFMAICGSSMGYRFVYGFSKGWKV